MKRQAKRGLKSKALKRKVLARKIPSRTRLGTKPIPTISEDPRRKQFQEQYEMAVSYMNHQKYEKAMALFEKTEAGPFKELAERARVHLNICRQRLERRTVQLRTAEDHYNYAVAQINAGSLEEAEEHLNRALRQAPKADHVHYALATVQSLRGNIEAALETLKTAIDLEPRNRYLARNDSDFAALCEDPRYADLVYPEKDPENGS